MTDALAIIYGEIDLEISEIIRELDDLVPNWPEKDYGIVIMLLRMAYLQGRKWQE